MFKAKKFFLDYQNFLSLNFASPGKSVDQHSFLAKNLYHALLQNIKNQVLSRAGLLSQDYDIFVTVISPSELLTRWHLKHEPIIVDLFAKCLSQQAFLDQPIFVTNQFFALLLVIIPKKIISTISPVLWGGEMVESVSKKSFSIKNDVRKFFVGTAFVAQVYFLEKYLRENHA